MGPEPGDTYVTVKGAHKGLGKRRELAETSVCAPHPLLKGHQPLSPAAEATYLLLSPIMFPVKVGTNVVSFLQ